MGNIRVSEDFLKRLKAEQDIDETLEETLRYLLGWLEDDDDEEEEDG